MSFFLKKELRLFFCLAASVFAYPSYSASDLLRSDPLNSEEAIQYYNNNKEYFVVKDISELPQNLKWQNASNLKEFSDPNAKRGGRIKLRMEAWPASFRMYGPNRVSGANYWFQNGNNIRAIERHGSGQGFVPGFASEWAVLNDHKSIFIKLQPNAEYNKSWIKLPHNVPDAGKIINFPSEKLSTFNIFFAHYLFLSNKIFAPEDQNAIKENVESLTIYSPEIIELKLKNPALFLEMDAGYYLVPLPRRYFSPIENQNTGYNVKYDLTYQWSMQPALGPYYLEIPSSGISDLNSLSLGRFIRYSRNQNWWGDNKAFLRRRFNVDSVTFKLEHNFNKSLTVMSYAHPESFDLLSLDGSDANKLEGDLYLQKQIEANKLQLAIAKPNIPYSLRGLYLNTEDPLLKDPKIRQAISMSMHTEMVNNLLFHGNGHQIRVFNEGFGAFDSTKVVSPRFNPQKAREIFSEVGFKIGHDGVFEHPKKGRLRLTISTFASRNFDKECIIYKEFALKAGIEVICNIQERTVAISSILKRNYQVALLGFIVAGAMAPNYETFVHGKIAKQSESWNISQINDAQLNSLIDEMSRSLDIPKSAKLSQEIQERISSLNFFIPSIEDTSIYYLAKNRVKFPRGVDADIASGIFDYHLFWIDDSGSANDLEKSDSSFEWFSPSTWFK